MKRLLLLITLFVGIATTANAVLKEKDLEQTLTFLQAELEQYYNELNVRSSIRKDRTKTLITQMLLTMKQADQNALMLYSQQQDNVFDLTYACHEATKQYYDFHRGQLPFTQFLKKTEADLARYDSLIVRLESMPDMMTTKYGKIRRDSCLVLARNIRELLGENEQQLKRNIRYYNMAERRLSEMNDFAQKRYTDIQRSIFINGGESYLTLMQNLPRRWKSMTETLRKKYSVDEHADRHRESQWSSIWVFGMFFGVPTFAVIYAVVKELTEKRLTDIGKPVETKDYSGILGKTVRGRIDRPLGSHHPRHPDMRYPLNYGFVDGIMAGDGAEQDVYVLGVDRPLQTFTGTVVAVYHRLNDVEDKWIVSTDGRTFSRQEILSAIAFQEQYFMGELYGGD